jgi:undecaprenyl-diphosphatase
MDRALFTLINTVHQHPVLDVLMLFVTNKWNFILPTGLIALYLLTKGGRRGRLIVLCAVVLVLCADGGATALRNLFQRVRPCQALHEVRLLVGCSESFSFPSNHATNSFALAAFFAVHYRRLAVPLFVLAATVGYSRIYVGVHYPADVLAGAVLGTVVGLAAAVGSRALGKRWLDNGGRPIREGR